MSRIWKTKLYVYSLLTHLCSGETKESRPSMNTLRPYCLILAELVQLMKVSVLYTSLQSILFI